MKVRRIAALLTTLAMVLSLMGAPLPSMAAGIADLSSESATETVAAPTGEPAAPAAEAPAAPAEEPAAESPVAPAATVVAEETSSTATTVTPAAAVCMIGVTTYNTLDAALATITTSTHTTIKLLADIADTDGLVIINKNITFDLNGFDLAISNTGSTGLYVDGGAVDYTGAGTFTASATDGHALHVDQNNASCTLTGVTADSASGYDAVLAYPGATVIVNGDVTATGNTSAVDAFGTGCQVTVNGTVTAENDVAVQAYGGAQVTVNGDVTSSYSDAIDAYDGASVTVVGDVSGAYGIYAALGESDTPPTVTVTGNVTGTDGDAIDAYDGATVTVNGDVSGYYDGIAADGSESGLAPTVTVTGNVSGSNSARAIIAYGAIVTVTGDVTATGDNTWGIIAWSGSQVTVTGDISTENGDGVYAQSSATVIVTGNVSSNGGYAGIAGDTGAAVTVNGDVTATGDVAGITSWNQGTLMTVNGNVTSDYVGAAAGDGGQVIVNGTLTAPDYIVIEDTVLTADDFVDPTTMIGYKTYTDDVSTVWVKDPSQWHSVTVLTDGNGTASASAVSAVAGTTITLTATPNAGYRFKGWQVIDSAITLTGNTFVMPGSNVTVKALFEKIPANPLPIPKTKPLGLPGTGDSSSLKIPVILMGYALIALTGLFFVVRNRRTDTDVEAGGLSE